MSDSKDRDAYQLESKGPEDTEGGGKGDIIFLIRTFTSRGADVVNLGRNETVGDLAQYIMDQHGNVAVYFNTDSGRINVCERFTYGDTLGVAFEPLLRTLDAAVVNLYVFPVDTRGNPLFRVEHILNARGTNLVWPPSNSIEPFNEGPIGTWTGWGRGPFIVPDDVDNRPSHLFGLKDGDTITLYNVVQLERAIRGGRLAVHEHVADMVHLNALALTTPGTGGGHIPVVDAATGENVGFY